MVDVFIARQPIYDRKLQVVAYELLYRSGLENRADHVDGDQATSQVILNAFLEIGIDNIVGPRRAYINLTRSFLMDGNLLPFPSDTVVLEVLEDIRVDQSLVDALYVLKRQGYTIALDDFIYHEQLRPLVQAADVVKIDVMALDRDTVARHVKELRPCGVKLLAEKVETQSDFEYLHGLGFDYFQGYFLCKPNIIKGHRIPANRVNVFQLVSKLQNPSVSVQELESIISHDIALSYKLLRYINSAFFGFPRRIESIHQAVVYLGLGALRNWVTLMALAGVDDKPHGLIVLSMVRAKMCERLVAATGRASKEAGFIVGLFSALDAMMDQPMDKVIESLPLSADVAAALLERQGFLGEVLTCALAYERGEFSGAVLDGVENGAIEEAYLEAVAWADRASGTLAV